MNQPEPTETSPVILTPAEKYEVLNALYFYEATLNLDLTGQELGTLQTVINKIEGKTPE
ncbi:hypothetical protein [Adhaeribacter terreus]|uniref:Uncharacterized protein n=1 Tax=Adhaeribacter terreus TaxID=529703 RepID=A0ABW0E6L8_9BACT